MKMLARGRKGERGAALVEFSIGAAVFMTVTLGVMQFGVLLWTHNALTDAARRGARYAVSHSRAGAGDAQRMAVYGTTDPAATTPLVTGLTPGMVKVTHSGDFNVGEGTVTVKIDSYDFNFVVPLVGTKIRMPDYNSTLTAESAGTRPLDLP